MGLGNNGLFLGVIHPCASAEHHSLTTVQIKAGLQSIQLIIIQFTSQGKPTGCFQPTNKWQNLTKGDYWKYMHNWNQKENLYPEKNPGVNFATAKQYCEAEGARMCTVDEIYLSTKKILRSYLSRVLLVVFYGLRKTARVYLSLRLPPESGTKAPPRSQFCAQRSF